MSIVEVISCFQEMDLLEAHLTESVQWADKIYLIESPVTFSSVPKEMLFEKNKERFKRFNVEYLVTPPEIFTEIPFEYPREHQGYWYRERRKNRNLNRTHWWDHVRKGTDYVYMNDVDEFISAAHFSHLEELMVGNELHYISIKARKFNFFVNCRGSKQDQWRITRSDLPSFEMYKGTPRKTTKKEIGWHFTNCFSTLEEHHQKAIGICCHVGMSASEVPSLDTIKQRLQELKDPLVDHPLSGGIKELMPLDDLSWAPKFMRENLELYPWLSDAPEDVVERTKQKVARGESWRLP